MADHGKEVYSQIRGLVAYGKVTAVNDNGQAQTVDVSTAENVDRAQVEVHQVFGFASCPPIEGAIGVVFAVGADPANLVALPLACPSQRMGGLEPGEAAMYAADGTRIHLKLGGAIEIWGGSSLTINTPGMTVNAPDGMTVNGPVTATDFIVEGVGSLKSHIHPTPSGNSGTMEE